MRGIHIYSIGRHLPLILFFAESVSSPFIPGEASVAAIERIVTEFETVTIAIVIVVVCVVGVRDCFGF